MIAATDILIAKMVTDIKTNSLTVPMRHVHGLIKVATGQGVSQDALLEKVSIDRGLLESPRARVNLVQFSRLYAEIVTLLEDESLGLYGHPARPGSIELLCRVGASASMFTDCAYIVARGCNAVIGGFKVDCVTVGDEVQIRFTEREEIRIERLLAYEILLLTIYAILSWLVGQRLPIVYADFPCPTDPRHLPELRKFFEGKARFDQTHAALHFSTQANALHVVRRADEIAEFMRRSPGSFFEALLGRNSLAFEVRRILQRALPVLLSLNQVADHFAISPRTLTRKLEAAGAHFQEIKDELRRDIALNLLTRGTTPLKQIATDLGFSDQSTFQRAFVDWTGVPPAEYRRRTKPSKG